MYVRKERLDLRRYWKQGGSGLPQPKFKGSEMSFPAFSTGHFQEINTKENAIISCLIYISGVKLSAVKVQCSREKKDKTVRPPWRLYKQRARCLPFRRRYRHKYHTKIYQSSRWKTLSGNKNVFSWFHLYVRAYARIWTLRPWICNYYWSYFIFELSIPDFQKPSLWKRG